MTKIKFVCNVEGFEDIEDFQPKPANRLLPEWYKNIPADNKTFDETHKGNRLRNLIPNVRTVKFCPSFVDVFNEGFVMLAPCDIWLRVEEDGEWEWKCSNPTFGLDIHGDNEYSNFTKGKVKKVFKLGHPWKPIVPMGYSIRQVPLFYDFNSEWTVAYGTWEADNQPDIGMQILYLSDNNEVFIKAGEPLCYYVPYKREKFTMTFDDIKIYKRKIEESWHRSVSAFKNASRKFYKYK